MGGGLQGQQSIVAFPAGGSSGGKIRGRGLDLPRGWVTPPRSTSRGQRLDGAGFGEGHGDAKDRGIVIRRDRPVFRIAGGGAPWTSVFRVGGVSFRLPPGKERDVDGQVPDIADDGFERGFDAFVPSLGFPGECFDRGFDPLEPLLVPAFGALAEVRKDRNDDRHASEDDTRDSDPFLTSHG